MTNEDDWARRERDGWVGPLLKAEAARHEPDQLRILNRVRAGMGQDGGALPDAVPLATHRRWAVPALSAAAAIVLIGGVMTGVLANRGEGPGQATAPGATGPGGTSSPPIVQPTTPVPEQPTVTGTGAPTTGNLGPPASGTASGSPSGPPASGSRPAASPSTGASGTRSSLSVEAARTQFSYGPAGRDWLVIGARPDGAVIRQKGGRQLVSGPHVFGSPVTTIEPGPFTASWTAGFPEQSRTGATTWSVVRSAVGGPASGLAIQIDGTTSGRLTILGGAVGVPGTVEVTFAGSVRARHALPVGARQVVVDFQNVTGSVLVAFVAGPNGGVGVSGALLS